MARDPLESGHGPRCRFDNILNVTTVSQFGGQESSYVRRITDIQDAAQVLAASKPVRGVHVRMVRERFLQLRLGHHELAREIARVHVVRSHVRPRDRSIG